MSECVTAGSEKLVEFGRSGRARSALQPLVRNYLPTTHPRNQSDSESWAASPERAPTSGVPSSAAKAASCVDKRRFHVVPPRAGVAYMARTSGRRLAAKGMVMAALSFLTFSTDIEPNTTGLPGLGALERIVGGLLTVGLIAAVAGIALAAIAWAVGSHSSNPHVAGRGKTGVLVSLAAAMLIGAANTLVHFFNAAGASIR